MEKKGAGIYFLKVMLSRGKRLMSDVALKRSSNIGYRCSSQQVCKIHFQNHFSVFFHFSICLEYGIEEAKMRFF